MKTLRIIFYIMTFGLVAVVSYLAWNVAEKKEKADHEKEISREGRAIEKQGDSLPAFLQTDTTFR